MIDIYGKTAWETDALPDELKPQISPIYNYFHKRIC